MDNEILISNEVEAKLKLIISSCSEEVNIISGFCKLQSLKYIDSLVSSQIKKRLLVRFLPSDIASGATDKEIFRHCIENGWSVYIDHTIHAKSYIVDRKRCIIGSANLTSKGLGVSDISNKEASVFFILDDKMYSKLMSLYEDSVPLDQETYDFIVSQVDDEPVIKRKKEHIAKRMAISELFPDDFPNDNCDLVELYQCGAFRWLVGFLKGKESKSAFFGEIAEAVHNIFDKSKKYFRKDIKAFLVLLLDAIKRLNVPNINISIPKHHSEQISLVD